MPAIQVYDGDGTSVKAGPDLIRAAHTLANELPLLVKAQEYSTREFHTSDEQIRTDVAIACYHLGGAFVMLRREEVSSIEEGMHLALEGLALLSNKSRSLIVRAGANLLLNLSGEISRRLS